MIKNVFKISRKERKYPVKRDVFGDSARKRAFELFDKGKLPSQAAQLVDISKITARRYFADW